MTGLELVKGLLGGTAARPPYVPLLGEVTCVLGQVEVGVFTTDAQAQAQAITQTATALGADALTVGWRTDPAVGCDVVKRVRPLAAGRAVVACLGEPDVAGVRAYCDAGVDMVLLVSPDRSKSSRFRTIANACAYYTLPVVLVDPDLEDPTAVACELGLDGAVVARPTGSEPGIVGGGLSADLVDSPDVPVPPRRASFFWSFAGEVPATASPESLADLGRRLTELTPVG